MFEWFRRLRQGGRTLSDLGRRLEWKAAELAPWAAGRPAGYYYRRFYVPKRRGGRRQIDAPNEPLLALQTTVYRRLLRPLTVHPAATGFVPGRSILDNALPHVRQAVVLNVDLQDFFHHVTAINVTAFWRRLGWGTTAAAVLTTICCDDGHLPQGAPTSPALSNLLNHHLDARLSGLARHHQGQYTRYADDITLSFSQEGRFLKRVSRHLKQIVESEGYVIQPEKGIRIQRVYQQQIVTGLVVNDRVRLPRTTRRRIRALQHQERLRRLGWRDRARLRGYESLLKMLASAQGGSD